MSSPPTDPLCYVSSPGCTLAATRPFHWCAEPPGHRPPHRCRCGTVFLLEAERGDAWEPA